MTIAGFEAARAIADAVLYEGYVLYPYRASARKNQARWQFGVLSPPAYVALGTGERDRTVTEVLVEAGDLAALRVRARYLQLQSRSAEILRGRRFVRVDRLEVDGELLPSYREMVTYSLPLVVLTKLILLYALRTHSYMWRQTSLQELLQVMKAL